MHGVKKNLCFDNCFFLYMSFCYVWNTKLLAFMVECVNKAYITCTFMATLSLKFGQSRVNYMQLNETCACIVCSFFPNFFRHVLAKFLAWMSMAGCHKHATLLAKRIMLKVCLCRHRCSFLGCATGAKWVTCPRPFVLQHALCVISSRECSLE